MIPLTVVGSSGTGLGPAHHTVTRTALRQSSGEAVPAFYNQLFFYSFLCIKRPTVPLVFASTYSVMCHTIAAARYCCLHCHCCCCYCRQCCWRAATEHRTQHDDCLNVDFMINIVKVVFYSQWVWSEDKSAAGNKIREMMTLEINSFGTEIAFQSGKT